MNAKGKKSKAVFSKSMLEMVSGDAYEWMRDRLRGLELREELAVLSALITVGNLRRYQEFGQDVPEAANILMVDAVSLLSFYMKVEVAERAELDEAIDRANRKFPKQAMEQVWMVLEDAAQ